MMTPPKPEHRISALEKRTATLEATIEELSSDQAEELRAIRQEIKDSYKEIGDFFVKLDEGLETVKTTMTTKEDLSKLEAKFEARINRLESTQTEQGLKLDQILTLLQQKLGQ